MTGANRALRRLNRAFRWLADYRAGALLAGAALAAALYFLKPPMILKISLTAQDIKFSVRNALGLNPKPWPRLLIVAVDEPSVNKLGRWPWRRDITGELFTRLGQADLVGLDIVFSEPTQPPEDDALARSIASAGNVILGAFFRDQATEATTVETLDMLQDCAYTNVELHDEVVGLKIFDYSEVNIPEIAAAGLTCAFFNTEPDPDGLYRRYPIAFLHKGFLFPPLAVQMAQYTLNRKARLVLDRRGVSRFALGDVTAARNNYLGLNFYQTADVPIVSALDVYEGRIPPDRFKDRLVLVGVTESGVFDLRPIPIDPVAPGVVQHFTALSNFLQDEFLTYSQSLDLSLIALALLLVLCVSHWRNVYQRFALYGLSLAGVYGISVSLFLCWDWWARDFYALVAGLISIAGTEVVAFTRTELRASELRRAFTSYVSADVVREILVDPSRLRLGGEEREITILFNDIRGFTTLSERVSPSQLVNMLTQIRDPMTQVVLSNRGCLDKYIGDALMALFNAPAQLDDHADRACQTALEMIHALREINERFSAAHLPAVDVGVGINTGLCVVGNMGSRVRFEYTAIGDAVNLASRLEGLCKTYRVRIVVSQFTRDRLTRPFLTRRLDSVRVKGKDLPVEIFEVMEDTEENRRLKERYERALDLYRRRDFVDACEEFQALSGDGPSAVFVSRCAEYVADPPGSLWDGVYTLETK